MNALVVMTTAPDRETGLRIGRALVERKLAACVSVLGPCTSLYRWRAMALGSPEGLAAKPHPPKLRLTAERLPELEGLLLQGATAHGWPNALWSAQRVAEMIRRHFGVEYHAEHVRKIIRHRLHWSSQKPQPKAKQRDDEKIDH